MPGLLQGQQVRDDLIQFVVRQLHVGHITTLFDRLRVAHPGLQFFGCIGHGARAQCFTTHQMRQVGTERAPRLRFPDRVTIDTGSGKENVAAGPRLWVICRRLFLFGYPFGEFLGGCTITRSIMCACCMPQYSAQLPT